MKRLKTFFYWGFLQSVWRWRGCLDVGDDVVSAGWDHLRFNLIPVLVLSIFWQIFWVVCVKQCCATWAVCYHGVPDSSGFLGWECALTKPTDGVGCVPVPLQDALHSPCVWALMRHLGKQVSPLSWSRTKVGGGRESSDNSWEYSERKMPLIIEFVLLLSKSRKVGSNRSPFI